MHVTQEALASWFNSTDSSQCSYGSTFSEAHGIPCHEQML